MVAIIEAVCARDPDRADRAMRVHLDSVLKVIGSIAAARS